MKSFFRWRDQIHERKELHPLIAACQLIVYFLHIHPFPDGNGRVGRMIMHDYMVRQGYLPIVMINLERTDYLQMISNAQDGRPENFVLRVVKTQLDEMRTCRWHN
jgi:Fic family protein